MIVLQTKVSDPTRKRPSNDCGGGYCRFNMLKFLSQTYFNYLGAGYMSPVNRASPGHAIV